MRRAPAIFWRQPGDLRREHHSIRGGKHGIELESLNVEAKIHWDFRGTMGVDRAVPVGATRIELHSRIKVRDGVDEERARRLIQSAERYCSTLQTLRNGVEVETDLQLE
jgi:uncharacterized OsmC-like protein